MQQVLFEGNMVRPASIGLVADSHQVFGYGVAGLLGRHLGLTTVLTADSYAEARQLLTAHPAISIAVFDLSLSGLGGLLGVASLRAAYPDLRLAVVGDSPRREDILDALAVGVHGYLPRSITTIAAVEALQAIADGNIYVPAELAEIPGAPPLAVASPGGAKGSPLTNRQHEIMLLLAQGKTNKQIAQELRLAEGTVKVHVSAVFRALNVHDRADILILAAAGRPPRS